MAVRALQFDDLYELVVAKDDANPAAWSEREQFRLLCGLLRPCIGVRQSRQVAFRLLQRFGSLSEVIAAPPKMLEEVAGVGAATARQLSIVLDVAKAFAGRRIACGAPLLSSWPEVIDYCHAQMAFEPTERLRILFLDSKNRLIADEVQQTGTVDHTPVYPREVIKRALELSAVGMILVHNHPSGDPAPSSADVRMTRQITDIAKPLGITLHDHIIIGKSGHTSLRGLKLL